MSTGGVTWVVGAFVRRLVGVCLVAVASLGVLLVEASPASAECGCQAPTDSSGIDAAAGALSGTILGSDGPLWVIEVAGDAKDNLPDQVAVEAYENDGDNCGVIWMVGRGIATAVHPNGDGHLEANGCDELTSDQVEKWTWPVGQTGRQPDLVLGGNWTIYRSVAFAGDERVAFGYEPGTVRALAVCPAEQNLVELVEPEDDGPLRLAVRDLASFEVRAEEALPDSASAALGRQLNAEDSAGEGSSGGASVGLACLDPEGAEVQAGDGGDAQFYQFEDGTLSVVPAPTDDGASDTAQPGDDSSESGIATASQAWPWLVSQAASSVSLNDPPTLESVATAPTASALELSEPPDIGRLSPWLLVFAGAVGLLYVAKNSRNADWRRGWSRPRDDRDEDGYQQTNWFDRFRP